MNKNIKKISNGAMFLAIIGAALLVNRGLSFIFDQYVSIVSSLVLIIYIRKFSFKDGLVLAFGIFLLSFMFGGTYVFLYAPLSIIAGLTYGYGVSKDYDSKKIIFNLIVIYTIGEFILTFILLPMFGFGELNDVVIAIQEMLAFYGIKLESDTLVKFTKVAYAVSVFFLAVIEAILLHLLCIIIFKKFKLGEIKMRPISEVRIKPIYAYVSIIAITLTILAFKFIENETVLYSLLVISMLSGTLLVAQGYIFCLSYGIIVLRKNVSLLLLLIVVFTIPYSIVVLLVLGFLYATGPLYRYIIKKRGY